MNEMSNELVLRMIASGFAEAAGEIRGLSDEVKSLSTQTGSSAKASHKAGKEMSTWDKITGSFKSTLGMAAGPLGMLGLAFGIKEVMSAGQQWTAQQAQLKNALIDTGHYSKKTLGELTDSADTLSTHGGFSAPQNLGGLATFVRISGSVTKAMKLQTAATNLARGADQSYGQIQSSIQAALAGRARGLQKFLPLFEPVKRAENQLADAHQRQIDQLTTEATMMGGTTGSIWLKQREAALDSLYRREQQHAQMMDKQANATEMVSMIEKRYAGATKAYSNTMAGAWSNAVNQMDLFAKSLSQDISPVLVLVFHGVTKLVGGLISMVDWANHNKATVIALIGPFVAYAAITRALALRTKVMNALTRESMTLHKAETILFGEEAGEVGLLTTVQAAYTVALEGMVAAGEEATIVQKGMAAAQAILNVAMDANPVMLVVIAIAALAAGLVYAYTHLKWFRDAVQAVWNWLKGAVVDVIHFVAQHWKLILSILGGPFVALPLFVATHFHKVLSFLEGIGGKIAGVGKTIWHGLKTGFIDIVNWIIGKFNSIPFIHGVNVPFVGHIAGIPKIPLINEGGGGSSSGGGGAVGERGGVVNSGARPAGGGNGSVVSGGSGPAVPPLVHTHVVLQISGRDFARASALSRSQLKAAS